MTLPNFSRSLLREAGIHERATFDYALVVRLIRAIESRFDPLYTLKGEVESAVEDLRKVGLTRINDVLLPAIESILAIQERGFLIARSTSEGLLGEGNILSLFVQDEDERQTFTPSPFTILTREETVDDWAVARTVSYDRENGQYLCEVLNFVGDAGPHNDWIIGGVAGNTLAALLYMEAAQAAKVGTDADKTATLLARNAAQAAATLAEIAIAGQTDAATVAHVWTYKTGTADADPGDGNLCLNNADATAATQIYVDNLVTAGGNATGWLDRFGLSTTTGDRGTLTLRQTNNAAKWATYKVTASVEDGTGYRKITATYLSGPGGFEADATVALRFEATGNRGADGEGSGDVLGPAGATAGRFAIFDDTTGKVIAVSDWSAAALVAAFGGKADSAHTHGTTGLDDGAVTFAKLAAAILASQGEAEAGSATDKLLTAQRGKQQLDANAEPLGRMRGVDGKTANYTLVLSDAGKMLEMANSSARTFTIPPNSSVAFPVGTYINFCRTGTGAVSFLAGSGVTIRAPRGTSIATQYGSATIYKRATNEWVVSGDLN